MSVDAGRYSSKQPEHSCVALRVQRALLVLEVFVGVVAGWHC